MKRPIHPSLWASWKPFGIGEQHPNNFGEISRAIRENRDQAGYAWRIISQGVCDGCALGVAGLHDWTIDGPHLCNIRLRLAAPEHDGRARHVACWPDVGPLRSQLERGAARTWATAVSDDPPDGRAGFPPHPLGRGAGPHRRSDPGDGAGPDRLLPDQPRHPERDLLRRPRRQCGRSARTTSTTPPGSATRRARSRSRQTLGVAATTCSYTRLDRHAICSSSSARIRPTTSR